MRYFLLPLMALALFNSPVFAKHKGDCKCDTKCAEACKSGHGEKCKCKACDCAKTGKCGGEAGHCENDHHKDGKDVKEEAPKEAPAK